MDLQYWIDAFVSEPDPILRDIRRWDNYFREQKALAEYNGLLNDKIEIKSIPDNPVDCFLH